MLNPKTSGLPLSLVFGSTTGKSHSPLRNLSLFADLWCSVIGSVGKIGTILAELITVHSVNQTQSIFQSFAVAFWVNFVTLGAVFLANRVDEQNTVTRK